ncbi:GST class-kappa [Intoshia linei]|uniref:GST class-kappa n=1 Tax=Intoshia linei TaxID=1819745 RepID=A0A177BC36_9BILA|nr:GST class-kappa [Intoshia linei]
MTENQIAFFFDIISPYSYLAFERLCKFKKDYNFVIDFTPINLGHVMFSANNIPSTFCQNKFDYTILDLERQLSLYNIEYNTDLENIEKVFEKSTQHANILLIFTKLKYPDKIEDTVREIWKSFFVQIARKLNLLERIKIEEIIENEEYIKIYKENTNQLLKLGGFGAPHFLVNNTDFFWGSDRFESIKRSVSMKENCTDKKIEQKLAEIKSLDEKLHVSNTLLKKIQMERFQSDEKFPKFHSLLLLSYYLTVLPCTNCNFIIVAWLLKIFIIFNNGLLKSLENISGKLASIMSNKFKECVNHFKTPTNKNYENNCEFLQSTEIQLYTKDNPIKKKTIDNENNVKNENKKVYEKNFITRNKELLKDTNNVIKMTEYEKQRIQYLLSDMEDDQEKKSDEACYKIANLPERVFEYDNKNETTVSEISKRLEILSNKRKESEFSFQSDLNKTSDETSSYIDNLSTISLNTKTPSSTDSNFENNESSHRDINIQSFIENKLNKRKLKEIDYKLSKVYEEIEDNFEHSNMNRKDLVSLLESIDNYKREKPEENCTKLSQYILPSHQIDKLLKNPRATSNYLKF